MLGDGRMLSAACLKARTNFEKNRSLSIGDPETDQKIAEAQEVARLLRQNIVQGEPDVRDREKYRM